MKLLIIMEVAIRPAAGHSLQGYSSGNAFARAQWAGFGVISALRALLVAFR